MKKLLISGALPADEREPDIDSIAEARYEMQQGGLDAEHRRETILEVQQELLEQGIY